MNEILVNRLGGLSLPRKSVVRLTDRPNMTLDVYRGRKTTMQQQQNRRRRNTGTGESSSSIPVQGVIDFPIVSSFYQHSFESPKSVKVRHERMMSNAYVKYQ